MHVEELLASLLVASHVIVLGLCGGSVEAALTLLFGRFHRLVECVVRSSVLGHAIKDMLACALGNGSIAKSVIVTV